MTVMFARRLCFLLSVVTVTLLTAGPAQLAFAEIKTINVRDLGAVGDGQHNDGPILQKALDLAGRYNGSVVVIPRGRYLLNPESEGSGALLLIRHANGLAVRGEPGTVLLDESGKTFFAVGDSSDVQITKLELDRLVPRYAQAIIESVGHNVATIRFNPGYSDFTSPIIAKATSFIIFDPKDTRAWGHHDAACAWFKPSDPSVCWPPSVKGFRRLPSGSWEVSLDTSLESRDVGNVAVIWNTSFKGHAFTVVNSSDVSVEDVNYYPSGTDGGFILNRDSGKIVFKNFVVDVNPGSDELISAIGGAMVFNNHVTVVLDHVRIVRTWDDDVNMGTNFARIAAHPSEASIIVDCRQANDWRVGDRVEIWDWASKSPRDNAHVATVGRGSDQGQCAIGLDHPVVVLHTGILPLSSRNNEQDDIDRAVDLDAAGKAIVQNSTFESLHAHGLVLKTSDSVVSKNLFENIVMGAISLGPGFYWDEGPTVKDLKIDNNVFRNDSGANIIVQPDVSGNRQFNVGVSIDNNIFDHPGSFDHGITGNPKYLIKGQLGGDSSINHNSFSGTTVDRHLIDKNNIAPRG